MRRRRRPLCSFSLSWPAWHGPESWATPFQQRTVSEYLPVGQVVLSSYGLLGGAGAVRVPDLLGAAGLGDIGRYFPPTDPTYKGISSLQMLKEVYQLVQERGWRLANLQMARRQLPG